MAYASYMFGYGSLLSRHSRVHHSGIHEDVIPATLTGWERLWAARYPDEGATYSAAERCAGSQLGGVLLPTEVTDELIERERFYDIVEIDRQSLSFRGEHAGSIAGTAKIWICANREVNFSTNEFPLPQTYIDTCLVGCFEAGGRAFAREFVRETSGWDHCWLNDRGDHAIYPRNTPTDAAMEATVDELLEEAGVLYKRQSLR